MLSFTFTSDPDWVPGLISDTQVLGGLRGPIIFFLCLYQPKKHVYKISLLSKILMIVSYILVFSGKSESWFSSQNT